MGVRFGYSVGCSQPLLELTLCSSNEHKKSRAAKKNMQSDLPASVNSISSIPSPVYQCKKALRRNMAVNCSEMRLNNSWMAVELPMKVTDILRPRGGISQTAVLTLLGIHSTKYELFLDWTLS